jgi:quinol monooxygenase YgiN
LKLQEETTMFTITAVIRARTGCEGAVEGALRAVLAHVKANEPGTIAYVVSQDSSDSRVFTTFERFADEAAMRAHNESAAVADFVAAAEGSLDGPLLLHSCRELDAKLP